MLIGLICTSGCPGTSETRLEMKYYSLRLSLGLAVIHVSPVLKGTMSAIFSNTLKSQMSHLSQRKPKNNSPVPLKVTMLVR